MRDLSEDSVAVNGAEYIDPDVQRILDGWRLAPPVDFTVMPIAEARSLVDEMDLAWNVPLPEISAVRDLDIPGPAGVIPARLYQPRPGIRLPVVLYLHGGGWTFGSIATYERLARLLALESGLPLLAIDYRLAPENPAPAALDDVVATLTAISSGILGGGIDSSRVAIVGDSAGANLALGGILAARDGRAPMPATAGLIYGCFAPRFDTVSHRLFGDGGFGFTTARMRWYWQNYLGAADANSLTAPLHANLSGLPPLYLVAAGLDPLRDDTIDLAARLARAGVEHELNVVPGMVHGFVHMSSKIGVARHVLRTLGARLGSRLASRHNFVSHIS